MERHGVRRGIGSVGDRLRGAGALSVAGLAVLLGAVYAGPPAEYARAAGPDRAAVAERGEDETAVDVAALERRVARVTGAWDALATYYDVEVAPLERVLRKYRNDPALAERIAVALVREGNAVGLDPRLLLAVLLVENPWLDPDIRSPVGAIGLMQIMPVHRGAWATCGTDLEDVDVNICHGARIFALYFDRTGGDVDRALLRYNGCVNGTNTPNCHQYPNHVFARAGRASVLAWLDQGPVAASP